MNAPGELDHIEKLGNLRVSVRGWKCEVGRFAFFESYV